MAIEAPAWRALAVPPPPDEPTLAVAANWTDALTGRGADIRVARVLPGFAANPRWYAWRAATTARFVRAYRHATQHCPSVPQDEDAFSVALDAFTLEKALCEVCYEAANRPAWLGIPLCGIGRLIGLAPSA
jgi:hypothetical protein